MSSKTSLKLLSLDDGGVPGMLQLLIMENIVDRLNDEFHKNSLPCEYFDLIGGSGTGGLIAILLGKLRMSVKEAKKTFAKIDEQVYAPDDLSAPQRTGALRRCMEEALRDKKLPIDLQLMEQQQIGCSCFVVASLHSDNGSTLCLQTYPVRNRNPSEITVVDAVLATCAKQPDFASVQSGSGPREQEYVSSSGAANPVHELISEAHLLFGGDAKVVSLLSLGTCHPGIISLPPEGSDLALLRSMRETMSGCEQRAQQIEHLIGQEGIYSRLSVETGFPSSRVDEINSMEWIFTQADIYLHTPETNYKLNLFVENIPAQTPETTLDHLMHISGLDALTSRTVKSLGVLKDDAQIAKLKPDIDRDSHVSGCLEGTRLDILEKVNNWAMDMDAPNILWINGYPGTGKSAIATSIVERLRLTGRLGSSFFFQRDRGKFMTPHNLWRTVAHDLGCRYSDIRKHLLAALAEEETVLTTYNIDQLFLKFIEKPLVASNDIPTENLPIIVIDALDECGGFDGRYSDHRTGLMQTIKRWTSLSSKFKLVVTSRRESDIERLFSTTVHRPMEILAGERCDPQSSSDIRAFLMHELRQFLAQRSALPLLDKWPGEEAIDRLVARAAGMFTCIKAFIRLLESADLHGSLNQILSGIPDDMADTYTLILHTSFPEPTEKVIKNFHSVLSAIILNRPPLDVTNLTRFLSIDSPTMQLICDGLSSIMDQGSSLRILHRSFVDFLLDPKHCPSPFLIKPAREDRNLTLNCLRVMKSHLRFNICDLETSYVRNQDAPHLASVVKERIPPYLSYASCHWADHLTETAYDKDINDSVQYFMRHQFLFWLEVMSLLERVNVVPSILQSLLAWIQKSKQNDALATDMVQFVAAFAGVISQSAPHIYISALPFAPRCLAVSKEYIGCYPQTLTTKHADDRSWPVIQKEFTGHEHPVTAVTFSLDGGRIISGSYDATIRIWNAETGVTMVGPLHGHDGVVNSISISHDGTRIVSGSWDTTIRIWDAETGKTVVGPLHGHRGQVTSVSFSPDATRIVSGSWDRTIRLWDAKTGQTMIGPLQGHISQITSVSFSPNGTRIVSGSWDKMIRVWDTETGANFLTILPGHEGAVSSICFSPDGTRIISGSWDKTIRVWDAETGNTLIGPLRGHTNWVSSVSFSPDGTRIISGSNDKTIRVWDAKTGETVIGPLHGHEGEVNSVSFSSQGTRIVSGSNDNTVRVWDAEPEAVVLGSLQGHNDPVNSVSFSRDGKRILSGSRDTTIRIWNAETGETMIEPFQGHNGGVNSVSFSPDDTRIVSGSNDNTIRIWNVETGATVIGPLKDHSSTINSVSFAPDGRRVVSGSSDNTIRIWDAETGETVVGPLQDHNGRVNAVLFSPDGTRIVSGSSDKTLRVWDAQTGDAVIGPLKGHDNEVSTVSWSSDGTRIASGSMDKTIRVWDCETGEIVIGPLRGHDERVNSVSFSPDGTWIVSGAVDKTIRVWDVKTGETVIGPLHGHEGEVNSVSFSSDGTQIVSGSEDNTIRVWDTKPTYSTTDIYSIFRENPKSQDGWILGPNGELLFWIPPGIRPRICPPRNVLVIDAQKVWVSLELEFFAHGQAWSCCKNPLVAGIEMVSGPSQVAHEEWVAGKHAEVITEVREGYDQILSTSLEDATEQKGYSYHLSIVGLNLELREASIVIDENTTFNGIGRHFYLSNRSITPVALEQLDGPVPRWRIPDTNARISRTAQRLYIADISIPFTLALVRNVEGDAPLLIPIPPHEIAPAVTVGETIATSLKGKNVTWSSIRLLTDSDDIQNVCFPDIQDRIKQLFSTELFILADSDPIAYKFRNDQDLQAHLPLRVAFLQCQRLVAAAPRHKIFGLPLIHLSRALLHLIISLAEEITREKLGDTTIASLISRMKSRVDDLKAIFVDVEDLAYPLLTAKKTLIGYFHKLCREQPGVVSVRYSFDSFNDFLSRSMELSRQANPGRPEEEHEASPANEVNEDDTSVSSDSLSTSESEASG